MTNGHKFWNRRRKPTRLDQGGDNMGNIYKFWGNPPRQLFEKNKLHIGCPLIIFSLIF